MKISNLHFLSEHDTSPTTLVTAMAQVAAIAEELEKIFPTAKSLVYAIVLSDRKGVIILIQDCGTFEVPYPTFNDDVLLMAHNVTPPGDVLRYVKARCYVTIGPEGWTRVLTHLSATQPDKECFDATKVAAAAYAILSAEVA